MTRRLGMMALLGAIALSSCAPALITPTARGLSDPATVEVAQNPQRVRVAAGPSAITLNKVVITGTSLRLNDARCANTARAEVTCALALDVPAGRAFALGVGGTNVSVRAYYTRGGLDIEKSN